MSDNIQIHKLFNPRGLAAGGRKCGNSPILSPILHFLGSCLPAGDPRDNIAASWTSLLVMD
jgi:hypothetical protein